MKYLKLPLALLLVMLLFTGCIHTSQSDLPKNDAKSADNHSEGKSAQTARAPGEKVHLKVAAYYGGWEYVKKEYEKLHPKVELEFETYSYEEHADKYLQALAEGIAPDMLVFDSDFLGRFNTINGLVNLLSPPYHASEYESDFTASVWRTTLSLDGSRLFAIPLSSSPVVTYYRADILEENGFPSDPEELGQFMENPANWLEIADKLKETDHWINQWNNDPLVIYGYSEGLYDRDLNFVRDTDMFRHAYEISRTVNNSHYNVNIDAWSEIGNKAVQSGKLAMLYLGTYGEDQIKAWAPDSASKWRATRLPFGVNGWANSASIAITEQSEHKEAAWDFIQYLFKLDMGNTTVPAYLPSKERMTKSTAPSLYLGGQHAAALYAHLAGQMKEHTVTPLDEQALQIWKKELSDAIWKNPDAKSAVAEATAKVQSELKTERDILLESFK